MHVGNAIFWPKQVDAVAGLSRIVAHFQMEAVLQLVKRHTTMYFRIKNPSPNAKFYYDLHGSNELTREIVMKF